MKLSNTVHAGVTFIKVLVLGMIDRIEANGKSKRHPFV